MSKLKILIVDDEVANLKMLNELFQAEYLLTFAKNGIEALQRATDSPDLILLDIMMPGIDGYEVCRRLKADKMTSEIPVIFLTALGQEINEKRGFEAGAVDYITKPIKPDIIRSRVETHMELRLARQALKNQNIFLEEKVKERTQEVINTRQEIIHRLGVAAEFRDPETGAHIQRMSHYSARLAEAYGLSKEECETILMASPMHDIGKIGIPDNILLKPGKLDENEWEIMKTHTTMGAQILENSTSNLIQAGRIIALSHHEKWDGTGYPKGLLQEDIPLLGRIVAVADVFDALTTDRPYKKAWPVEKAVGVIQEGNGTHFEPRLVDLFVQILSDLLEIKARFPD